MKILIAVLSCHSLRYYEESLRYTWEYEVPSEADFHFFLGKPDGVRVSDEVILPVEDDFSNLTHKTVAVYRWALEHGYDFVWKFDLDTLVRPQLLLSSGLEAHNWVGGQNSFFASGGAGYGLSKLAMEYVVEAGGAPGFEEDVHIARILLGKGLQLHNDERFKFCPGDVMDDRTITFHLSSVREWYFKGYRPEMLLEAWADQKARNYRSYTIPQAPSDSPQPMQKRTFRRK
jgi:hypothetical protein